MRPTNQAKGDAEKERRVRKVHNLIVHGGMTQKPACKREGVSGDRYLEWKKERGL